MTPEEKAQLDALCRRIVEEKDHETFVKLVQELNDLLESKEHRLDRDPSS
jgi:hypothetical protein